MIDRRCRTTAHCCTRLRASAYHPISVSDPIVEATWVAGHRRDPGVRLIEVDVSQAAYDEGHIPGAAFWNAYTDLRDPAYQPISRDAFADLLARSGIDVASTVVVYGYGAALGFWLLTANGLPDVRMLDGPRDAWVRAGEVWTTAEPPAPTQRQALPDELRSVIATRDDVMGAVDDPATALVDVRSDLEYAGERFWPSGATADAGRPGHIPRGSACPSTSCAPRVARSGSPTNCDACSRTRA